MQDTVLVVEDEADVVDLLRYNLERADFEVQIAMTGDLGLAMAREKRPDLIVLDLMLPGMNGHEVCRALKGDPNTEIIPIVMLTAKGEPNERVKGLELGADDYVTKPFSPRELVLRVQALLKRHRLVPRTEIVEVAGIYLNKTNFEARLDGKRFNLTTTEFKLLSLMLERRGRTLTRETLLSDVWGYQNAAIDTRTVDTHMRRLREKLGKYSGRLETIRGEGYRFNAVAES
ncbi:MAG: response regulator [Verrucomicrobiaceae bacterium]|nr:MAG: response regulator [Verrucomicrobiaceae bacterium]